DVGGPATFSRASRSAGGSALPRLSARRSIPKLALALRKYRCGTGTASKMSDNEHTPSSLGNCSGKAVHSDIFSVKDPVAPPVPQLPQRSEDGSERPSFVIAENPRDVFPDDPARPVLVNNAK